MNWIWIPAVALLGLFIFVLCWLFFSDYTCCPCRRQRNEPVLPTHYDESVLPSAPSPSSQLYFPSAPQPESPHLHLKYADIPARSGESISPTFASIFSVSDLVDNELQSPELTPTTVHGVRPSQPLPEPLSHILPEPTSHIFPEPLSHHLPAPALQPLPKAPSENVFKPLQLHVPRPPSQHDFKLHQHHIPKPSPQHISKPQQQSIPKPASEHISKPQQQSIPKPASEHVSKPQQQSIPKPASEHVSKPQQPLIPKPSSQLVSTIQQQLVPKLPPQPVSEPQNKGIKKHSAPILEPSSQVYSETYGLPKPKRPRYVKQPISNYFPETVAGSPHLHLKFVRNLSVRKIVRMQHRMLTIDLHKMTVKEATAITEDFIDDCLELGEHNRIRIITGKGIHSRDGVPKLKPAIEDLLEEHDLEFQESRGGGAFEVIL